VHRALGVKILSSIGVQFIVGAKEDPLRNVSCGERMENGMTRGFCFLPLFAFQMARHAATYFSAEAVSLQEVDGLPV